MHILWISFAFLGLCLSLSSCGTPEPVPFDRPVDRTFTEPPLSSSSRSSSVLPSPASRGSALITVPFSPQAPFAVWDPLHEEACEEMSLLMVWHYWSRTGLTRAQAEDEVQDLIAWEGANGYGLDVTMEELAAIAEKRYGLRSRILTDVTAETIEAEIAVGKPVIVPAAGRKLGNPYFSGLGPWYHTLVIVGYTDSTFITHDPGTRRGERYEYDKKRLLSVIHDWTGAKEEIERGRSVVLVIDGPR